MLIDHNISLRPFNTFGIEANAQYLATIRQPEDLDEVFNTTKLRRMRRLVLGGGSNILFTRSFLGLVMKMEIGGIRIEDENQDSVLVSAGAGERWHQLVLWAVEHGFGGIENLSLIPGTVGAAPMQNIGAYGVEIREVFHSLEAYEVVTGKTVRFYNEDCKFGYRYSVFKGGLKDKYIITRVYLRLSKKPVFNISYGAIRQTLEEMGVGELSLKSVSQAVVNIRESKLPDPMVIGNAGSFFKNPVVDTPYFEALQAAFEGIPGYRVNDELTKIPAAWMIEKTGWKGKRFGEVGVHDRQPLVLVNFGKGKGKDILKLSKEIQQSVFSVFGVQLEPEVNVF